MKRRLTISRLDLLLGLLALVSVLVYVGVAASFSEVGYPLDDAWIHQTYARNLASTGQWAFVPGQVSSASTAPLFTLLLTPAHILGIHTFFGLFAWDSWRYGWLAVSMFAWLASYGRGCLARACGQVFSRYCPGIMCGQQRPEWRRCFSPRWLWQ